MGSEDCTTREMEDDDEELNELQLRMYALKAAIEHLNKEQLGSFPVSDFQQSRQQYVNDDYSIEDSWRSLSPCLISPGRKYRHAKMRRSRTDAAASTSEATIENFQFKLPSAVPKHQNKRNLVVTLPKPPEPPPVRDNNFRRCKNFDQRIYLEPVLNNTGDTPLFRKPEESLERVSSDEDERKNIGTFQSNRKKRLKIIKNNSSIKSTSTNFENRRRHSSPKQSRFKRKDYNKNRIDNWLSSMNHKQSLVPLKNLDFVYPPVDHENLVHDHNTSSIVQADNNNNDNNDNASSSSNVSLYTVSSIHSFGVLQETPAETSYSNDQNNANVGLICVSSSNEQLTTSMYLKDHEISSKVVNLDEAEDSGSFHTCELNVEDNTAFNEDKETENQEIGYDEQQRKTDIESINDIESSHKIESNTKPACSIDDDEEVEALRQVLITSMNAKRKLMADQINLTSTSTTLEQTSAGYKKLKRRCPTSMPSNVGSTNCVETFPKTTTTIQCDKASSSSSLDLQSFSVDFNQNHQNSPISIGFDSFKEKFPNLTSLKRTVDNNLITKQKPTVHKSMFRIDRRPVTTSTRPKTVNDKRPSKWLPNRMWTLPTDEQLIIRVDDDTDDDDDDESSCQKLSINNNNNGSGSSLKTCHVSSQHEVPALNFDELQRFNHATKRSSTISTATTANSVLLGTQECNKIVHVNPDTVEKMVYDSMKKCHVDMLKYRKSLSEDKKRLRSLVSIAMKRKNDARLDEIRLRNIKAEMKKAQDNCASHRLFILRINKEIQDVQSRVDKNSTMQLNHDRQWKEIQSLIPRSGSLSKRCRLNSAIERFPSTIGYEQDLVNSVQQQINDTLHLTVADSSSSSLKQIHEPRSKLFAEFESPLVHFKIYRFNQDFLDYHSHLLSSPSLCNKIDPFKIFCPYSLTGVCHDPNCELQHECDYMLSEVEAIADLLAYCPSLTSGWRDGDSIIRCAEALYQNLKSRMNLGEILKECAHQIVQRRYENPESFVDDRTWKPSQIDSETLIDINRFDLSHLCIDSDDALLIDNRHGDSASCFRYYFTASDDDLNRLLPLKQIILRSEASFMQNADVENLHHGLKMLCSALEIHRDCSDLWLAYLQTYGKIFDLDPANQMPHVSLVAAQALKFAPCFEIAWFFWSKTDTTTTKDKTTIEKDENCYELCLTFLKQISQRRRRRRRTSFNMLGCIFKLVDSYVRHGATNQACAFLEDICFEQKITCDSHDLIPYDQIVLYCVLLHFKHFNQLPCYAKDFIDNILNDQIEIRPKDLIIPWSSKTDFVDSMANNIENYYNLIRRLLERFSDNADLNKFGLLDPSYFIRTTWPLHLNRIGFDFCLKRFRHIVDYCDKLLQFNGNDLKELLVISRFCMLQLNDR